jgi:methionyl-tRNA formyltransferase
LTVVGARVAGPASAPPGTITAGGFVAAGDGMGLDVVELQPEGKRPMSLAAYRNGHAWDAGTRLEAM